jgi:methylated-DNA-[protein]-cysteine S-methyltransferase
MQKAIKYTIFKTRWGYFGLVGTEFALLRTHLPAPEPEKIKRQLLKNLSFVNRDSRIEFEKALFKELQKQIIAYFEGFLVNFEPNLPLVLEGLSSFSSSALTACRVIRFGQTTSYSGLAKKIGRPGAARAVGSALAKNPLPLIIPCHRIIRGDGKIGGFSAAGGTDLKAKLLKHEQAVLIECKSS